jgi:hypothetical protein
MAYDRGKNLPMQLHCPNFTLGVVTSKSCTSHCAQCSNKFILLHTALSTLPIVSLVNIPSTQYTMLKKIVILLHAALSTLPIVSLVNIPPLLACHLSQQHPKAHKAYVARRRLWQGCRHQPNWKNESRVFVPLPAQWREERRRQQCNYQSGRTIRGSGKITGGSAGRQEAAAR